MIRLNAFQSLALRVVSCGVLIAACSDEAITTPGIMMPPAAGATAGVPAAGASAAGTMGVGTAGVPSTGVAGRAAVAGTGASGTGAAGMMAVAGRGPDTDSDAGADPIDAGMTTMPDSGSMQPPTMMPPTRMDLMKGDGSDVITIGDSWMNLGTTGIQQSLVKASGNRYRMYGRGGTRLLDEVIPNQYATAKRADADIKTVVMTGGGNDIIQVPGLRDDCTAMGDRCKMVVTQILDRLAKLWDTMATDGVQDVIYVQYSNPEGMNVDFALSATDNVKTRCAAVKAPLRCHTLETLDIVMGDIPDSIHPSGPAFDRIGKAVFDMMVKEGMRR